MALIPPQFIQGSQVIGVNPSCNITTNGVIAGQNLIAFGWAEGGGATPDVSGISDNQTNVYHQLYDTGLIAGGAPNFSGPWRGRIWWTTCSATGNVTTTLTAAGAANPRLCVGNYKNILNGSSALATFGNTAGQFSAPNQAAPADNVMYFNAWRYHSANINAVNGFLQDTPAGSPSFPTYHLNNGASGATPNTQTATNIGASGFFGIWAAQVLFTSLTATDPDNGNVFLGTPNTPGFGMTWMKNCCLLARDYWDQGLSSPYVGQIYPTPNTGGAQSGQTYPY